MKAMGKNMTERKDGDKGTKGIYETDLSSRLMSGNA
jgi:hypothetical protein